MKVTRRLRRGLFGGDYMIINPDGSDGTHMLCEYSFRQLMGEKEELPVEMEVVVSSEYMGGAAKVPVFKGYNEGDGKRVWKWLDWDGDESDFHDAVDPILDRIFKGHLREKKTFFVWVDYKAVG